MKSLFLLTSSSEVLKYVDTLRNLNLGEVGHLVYDHPGASDAVLYAKVKEFAPDLVVYIGARWGQQPAIATLARITEKIAPHVHICSDAADIPWHDLLREYHNAGAFTLQVAIDGSLKWPLAGTQMTALTPVDAGPYPVSPRPHAERTIICGYGGNQGGGGASKRTQILTALLTERVLDLRIRSALPFTYEAYASYLAGLRISLNTAFTGTEMAMHVKGRVLESALAGACLLETKGSPTAHWFRPGLDYLEYDSPQEAAQIIRHLSNEPEATQAMALSLRARVLAEHTPAKFWARIFERIGLNVSQDIVEAVPAK